MDERRKTKTTGPEGIPVIDITDKDLKRLTGESWEALQRANEPPFLFRYGNSIVEIIKERNHQSLTVAPLTADRLKHHMARFARWQVQTQSGSKSVFPNSSVMRDMMVTTSIPLPELVRVVSVPVFSSKGELQTTPGYHPESLTYFASPKKIIIPEIMKSPTKQDAIVAASFIMDELLQDFPFINRSDIAHTLGYLALFVSRELIDGCTPLHIFEASCPGTGKTLLIEILSYVGLGHFPEMMTEGKDEDEWRKRLTAKLLTVPPLVIIENVRRRIDSSHLAAALTMTNWEDRRLGYSEMIKAPIRAIWAVTGNNPQFTSEMARRSIRIRLNANSERPWLLDRIYKHPDIKKWVAENHGKVLGMVLTMVKAWIMASKPRSAKKLGMFEDWAQVIGGILEFAGIPGFLDNMEEFYGQSDMETKALVSFISAWRDKFLLEAVGTSELFDLATEFLELGYGNERSQRTRLGITLTQLRDRPINGFLIVEAGLLHGARQWRLHLVDQGTRIDEIGERCEHGERFSIPK